MYKQLQDKKAVKRKSQKRSCRLAKSIHGKVEYDILQVKNRYSG